VTAKSRQDNFVLSNGTWPELKKIKYDLVVNYTHLQAPATQRYSFDLRDYFQDDNYDNLVFKIVFDSNLINATINGDIFELSSARAFTGTIIANLIVRDGVHELYFPIQVQYKITANFENSLSLNNLKIYPKPSNEILVIEFPNESNSAYELTITDLSGKVVRLISGICESIIYLNSGDLKNGFYYIEVRGAKIYRGKIIIN